MILIISIENDQHVPFVTRRLDRLGEEYLWFDCTRFPVDSEIHISYARDGLTRVVLRVDDREYDLSAVKAIWLRRVRDSRPLKVLSEGVSRTYAAGVCTMVLRRLWELLDCRWLPATPEGDQHASNKLLQLSVAARIGWRLPRTLVTNSPEDFLAFYDECHGRMVTKLAAGASAYAQIRIGDKFPAFTRPVRRRDLASFRSLGFAPMMLQEYVPKRVELRITVVGTHAFAAEIDSQASPRSRDDWRQLDPDPEIYRVHRLPPEVEARCVRLVHELQLSYGALDVIVTPDGEYVFIEINPNGQWAWIEEYTRLPIADAITNYLVHGEKNSHGSLGNRYVGELASEPALAR